MAKEMSVGVGGVSRVAKSGYMGVNGVARGFVPSPGQTVLYHNKLNDTKGIKLFNFAKDVTNLGGIYTRISLIGYTWADVKFASFQNRLEKDGPVALRNMFFDGTNWIRMQDGYNSPVSTSDTGWYWLKISGPDLTMCYPGSGEDNFGDVSYSRIIVVMKN